MDAVMGMFDAMTNKITEAFERVGLPVAPAQDSAEASASPALIARLEEKDAQLNAKDAELSAKDAEIERLLAEVDRLKRSARTQPESFEEPETDWTEESEPGWAEDPDAAEPEPEIDWLDKVETVEAAEERPGEEEESPEALELVAFLDQSLQRAQSLTFVDRMRREGRYAAEISPSELAKYIEKIREQRKEIA